MERNSIDLLNLLLLACGKSKRQVTDSLGFLTVFIPNSSSMTRWTAYLITDGWIYSSTEFNGDMYPEGYGESFILGLEKVKTFNEFIAMLVLFNQQAHGYPVEEVATLHSQSFWGKPIVFSDDDYYEKYFSDWTFWKNATSTPVEFETRDEKCFTLLPGRTIAFNFGLSDDAFCAFKNPQTKTVNYRVSESDMLA